MSVAFRFVVENWELVSILSFFMISMLNSITRHYSNQTGLIKVLTVVTEYLSFLASHDVQSLVKLPLTSKPPWGKPGNPTGPAIVLVFFLSSCASWQSTVKTSLDITGTTATTVREVVSEYFKERCEGIALGCAKASDRACPELTKCQEQRHAIYTTLMAVHIARVAGYGAITMGDEEDAFNKAGKAMQIIGNLYKALTIGGVL